MGIQQVVPISITLKGNGAAAKFAFKLPDLPAINSAGKGIIINPRAVPVAVEGAIAERPQDTISISVTMQGQGQPPVINVNFDAPLPEGIFTLNMNFYFDSLVVSREAPPPPPAIGKGNGRRKKSFDTPRAGP